MKKIIIISTSYLSLLDFDRLNIYNYSTVQSKKLYYNKLINNELNRINSVDTLFTTFKKSFNNTISKTNNDFDFNCLKKMYSFIDNKCIKFYDYSLKYVELLVENCIKYGYKLSIMIIKNICS